MNIKTSAAAFMTFATLGLTGCASIVGDSNQTLSIASTPSQADVSIVDEKGKDVFEGKTPTTVTLDKSDGSYWGGKDYTLSIEKAGYAPKIIDLQSSPNGWYIAGNLVFGGLIGWFIVDPFSGSMYTLSPGEIDATLGESVSEIDNGSSQLNIVLLEDVPKDLRGQMQYLGQI